MFEYTGRSLRKAVTGEDIGILHAHLENGTILDLPSTDENLLFLLRNLIDAFPQEAFDHIKTRPWFPQALKSDMK